MHYYDHNIADYRKDTMFLSLLEHGIYRQLLDTYYLNETPLMLDDAKLMRTHCVRSADEMQAFKNVLQDYFIRTDEGYVHDRCDKVIKAYHGKSEKARVSAKARWSKDVSECNANDMRTHSEGNANHKPLTNNHKPVKEKTTPEGDIFLGIDPQIVSDFKSMRTKHRAPITKTAMNGIKREAVKAGIRFEDALRICCENNWRGFKAEWLVRENSRAPPKPEKFDPVAYVNRNRKIEAEDDTIIDIN